MKQPHTNGRSTGKMLLIIVSALLLMLTAGCGGHGANGGNSTPAPGIGSSNGTAADNGSSPNQGTPSNGGGITDPDSAVPDGDNNSSPGKSNSVSPSPDSGSGNSGPTNDAGRTDDSDANNGQGDGQSGNDGGSGSIVKAEGTYVGLADNHSVEITMNDNATVFQFGDELYDQLQQIDDKTYVAFEYKEKDTNVNGENIKQLWLTKIETLK